MESAENSSMEVIFKRALLMSAHFKYMAEDWRNGRECSSDDAKRNLIQAFDRYSSFSLFRRFLYLFLHF